MKKVKIGRCPLILLFIIYASGTALAWTPASSIGYKKIQVGITLAGHFDKQAEFWPEGRLAYGVSDQAEIFAGAGPVRLAAGSFFTWGYSLGLKWCLSPDYEKDSGLALVFNYRTAHPEKDTLSWLDLILESSWTSEGTGYYALLGTTVPKSSETSILLGAGFLAPFAELSNASFFLGFRYNTSTSAQEGYFSLESGINYSF